MVRHPLRRRVSDLIDISHRTSYLVARGAQTLPLDQPVRTGFDEKVGDMITTSSVS